MLLVPLSAGSVLHCALQKLGPPFHLFSSHAALRSAESPLCPGCGPQILLPSFLWLVSVAIAQVPEENILASTSSEVFLGKCIHSFKLSRPPAICLPPFKLTLSTQELPDSMSLSSVWQEPLNQYGNLCRGLTTHRVLRPFYSLRLSEAPVPTKLIMTSLFLFVLII